MKTKHITTCFKLNEFTPRFVALGLLAAVLLLLALTGCKQPSAANAEYAGSYALVQVDGKAVPCEIVHEGVALTIESGTFILNPDGTCTSIMVFSPCGHDEVRREVRATYTSQGAELTMKWEGAGVTIGEVRTNEFTMNNEGMVLEYRK